MPQVNIKSGSLALGSEEEMARLEVQTKGEDFKREFYQLLEDGDYEEAVKLFGKPEEEN